MRADSGGLAVRASRLRPRTGGGWRVAEFSGPAGGAEEGHAVTVSRTTDNLARVTTVHAADIPDDLDRRHQNVGERQAIPVCIAKLKDNGGEQCTIGAMNAVF